MKTLHPYLLMIIFTISCNSETIDIVESIETSTTTSSVTTTAENKAEFSHTWGEEFTDQEVNANFNQFFDIKFKDASVISEEVFYESAGFELDECIEIFEDDFISGNWSDEYRVNTTEEWCRRTVTLETEKTFEYPVVKENISISCKSEFNLYMDTFIDTYIKED